MPVTRRRLRQIVGALVVDRSDPAFARHLRRLRDQGFGVNVNLLGEYVLGEQEATRRLAAIEELLRRPDVDYVSVKASAVASQLNLWGYEQTLDRVMTALRRLFRTAAAAPGGPTFLNLDMEEYADLRLTVDAFTRLLDEPDATRSRRRDRAAGLPSRLLRRATRTRRLGGGAKRQRHGQGPHRQRRQPGDGIGRGSDARMAAGAVRHEGPDRCQLRPDARLGAGRRSDVAPTDRDSQPQPVRRRLGSPACRGPRGRRAGGIRDAARDGAGHRRDRA